MNELDERALEAAQAALHDCWDTNPEAPGQLYGKEAEMLARAAVTAYIAEAGDGWRGIQAPHSLTAEQLAQLLAAFAQINGGEVQISESSFHAARNETLEVEYNPTEGRMYVRVIDAAPPAAQEQP
jgi:hypothetical protein